ncbi:MULTISPECIES: hypothetical protein [Amycolatopsis]|uniref:Secreted protein n=1 Tax=Amycolatopsis bullii TaxID=941987 RepID=A0ABQ3KRV4_9PSEU|nr:hypothetical protein [Amycolatopsis bullii]GHG49667.1 hypothetical protein GCM10017567_85450 [Amycolatopsis bullii]
MKRTLVMTAAALGLAAGIAVPGTAGASTPVAGEAAINSTLASAGLSVPNEWVTYYHNYFYTETTCNSRGNAVTGYGTGRGEIPGTTAFYCYRNVGESKWSMDLYYD